MDTTHIHRPATHASHGLRRIVVAALAVGAAGLATASVLARPAPVGSPSSLRVTKTLSVSDLPAGLAASSDDSGPGCDEAAVARHP